MDRDYADAVAAHLSLATENVANDIF
ncbi:MAG: hypothetical protein ACD_54C00795G0001, partial [uncultured bacterium]